MMGRNDDRKSVRDVTKNADKKTVTRQRSFRKIPENSTANKKQNKKETNKKRALVGWRPRTTLGSSLDEGPWKRRGRTRRKRKNTKQKTHEEKKNARQTIIPHFFSLSLSLSLSLCSCGGSPKNNRKCLEKKLVFLVQLRTRKMTFHSRFALVSALKGLCSTSKNKTKNERKKPNFRRKSAASSGFGPPLHRHFPLQTGVRLG